MTISGKLIKFQHYQAMKKFLFWLIGLSALVCVLVACSTTGGLDATSWKLESYRDAEGEMIDVLPESVVTLDFQTDVISGIAGCNNYNGSYETTGSKIEIDVLAATLKMCTQPAGIMKQEDEYLIVLETAAQYNIKGNTLEMKDEQGELILVFVRSTAD